MEKQKLKKETVTIRITSEQKNRLKTIGKGNHRHGLAEILGIYDLIRRDPSIILQKKLEEYTSCIQIFASENHYEHFVESGLPAVLHRFNKTGIVDKNLFTTKRQEKPIDDFENKEADDAKDPV